MSIQTHMLKYGWSYLALLTLGTGTIFMADPILRRITLHDRVEIALAVVERCLATQTGTNAQGQPVYAVAPPVIVRTWADTNGASVIMTNAFEWRDDLSIKNTLDNKLKALCPYYVDTDSVYDGTTNIVMLTFTGLLVKLNLGDGTNFTATPCWTNNVGQTNETTNAATFGPWAWRNYIVAWQERYKVLNALKILPAVKYWNGSSSVGTNLEKTIYNTAQLGGTITASSQMVLLATSIEPTVTLGVADGTPYNFELASYTTAGQSLMYWGTVFPRSGSTYILIGASYLQYYVVKLQSWWAYVSPDAYFQNPGLSGAIVFQSSSTNNPNACSANFNLDENTYIRILNCKYIGGDAAGISVSYTPSTVSVSADNVPYRGSGAYFEFWPIIEYPFQYCTNAYWE